MRANNSLHQTAYRCDFQPHLASEVALSCPLSDLAVGELSRYTELVKKNLLQNEEYKTPQLML